MKVGVPEPGQIRQCIGDGSGKEIEGVETKLHKIHTALPAQFGKSPTPPPDVF
jgi:hypothetical protein